MHTIFIIILEGTLCPADEYLVIECRYSECHSMSESFAILNCVVQNIKTLMRV
jgi:hypothetical protein